MFHQRKKPRKKKMKRKSWQDKLIAYWLRGKLQFSILIFQSIHLGFFNYYFFEHSIFKDKNGKFNIWIVLLINKITKKFLYSHESISIEIFTFQLNEIVIFIEIDMNVSFGVRSDGFSIMTPIVKHVQCENCNYSPPVRLKKN